MSGHASGLHTEGVSSCPMVRWRRKNVGHAPSVQVVSPGCSLITISINGPTPAQQDLPDKPAQAKQKKQRRAKSSSRSQAPVLLTLDLRSLVTQVLR